MHYGWLEDKIWSLARSDWQVFHELPWCLVTCIDSSQDVKSIITAKKTAEWKTFFSFLGQGLVVSDGKSLEVAHEYGLFNGFDEIWLYQNRPSLEKPEEVSIIPPPLYLSRDVPSKALLEWFNASGCVLGLGDGNGMNYMTTSGEVVQSLNRRQQEFESGTRERESRIYSCGWLQDSIRALVESHWKVFNELPFALVTRIDGSDNLESIPSVRKIVESEDSCSFLNRSLLIEDGKLMEVVQRYNLFSQFNEVWLYEERPALDKPAEFSIVSPLNLSTGPRSKGLFDLFGWFSASGCVVGLGDGKGMNYITVSDEIQRSLHSRQQKYDAQAQPKADKLQ